MIRERLRRRPTTPDPPPMPITRRQYLLRETARLGVNPLYAPEAVSSIALEHPEWNMDELVDPETGEPIPAAPPQPRTG